MSKSEIGKTTKTIKTKDMGAIILAGGKSTRIGRDKAVVPFQGEPLLLRAMRILKELFGEVIVVKNQDLPFQLDGAKVVHDDVPYQGPLGGISAGLHASSHDVNFVVAVDMPFINPQVIDYLGGLTDEADIVIPRTVDGLEPLFAFYNKRCLPVIDEMLARGDRKIVAILPQVSVRVVGYPEIADLDGASTTFININTERDLERAERRATHVGTLLPGGLNGDRQPPVERAVTLYVNGEELVTVQSSLEHLEELACGFLVSEGILRSRDELTNVTVDAKGGAVRITLTRSRTIATAMVGKRFVTSGCGKGFSFTSPGDARGIGGIDVGFTVSAAAIPALMKEFLKSSRRSGMHSSALVRGDQVWLLRQDIGRHNTIDMMVGRLWLDGVEDRDVMLFTTGRISYEMVVKAAKARIPIVVSRTAATDLAIELAGELGIELIGYVRGTNMQVYTSGSRLE
ncbi:MAG: formate dehydrogenase accessory sulfurtransferase FdhD [Actinobacteria bacterium]|nr:formate dehydrogenase accessory sulfurtransferase FdhD [Actinomycetota bacterium]